MHVCETCRSRFKDGATVCPLDGGRLLALPDPLIDRTISGRYTIVEKIGAGGMGSVYRGRHGVFERDIALKFLAPELAHDPVSRTRFLREARAANRIQHEHIIEVTDFGETDDGLVFLVMEYLDGQPLSRAIAAGRMTLTRFVPIAIQLASALARAHELDIIHRDIKPDNVYLIERDDDPDFVKVLDFGIAHMKGDMRLTATGTVFGTPEYIAPEQARGAPLTPAVDLYALGCVFFEMLTGRLPFKGSTPELVVQHIRATPPKPSSLVPELPPLVDEILLRLLAKDPSARHADGYHLLEDLRRLRGGGPSKQAAPAHPPRRAFAGIMPAVSIDAARGAATRIPQTAEQTSLDIARWWTDRVSLLASLAQRAHPRGDVPPWLSQSIAALQADAARLAELRKQLAQLAQRSAETEQRARDTRLRIGRALDELVSDESRAARALRDFETRADGSRARLAEHERPLLAAWDALRGAPEGGMTVERASALREAGALAAGWLEMARAEHAVARELAERKREREDLSFQVAQLKGRLGAIQAEAEHELGELRVESARLDAALTQGGEAIAQKAAPVVQHFTQWPALRAALSFGQTQPDAATPAR
jgi:tRNA A-37 threonylcarbamoyl transferase component Bud32